MTWSYLIWLSVFVLLPSIMLFLLFWNTLRTYLKPLALAPLGALIFSVPWDIISVREHIWYFEEPYIVGVWFGDLPLEEYLFIIFVTLLFAQISVLVWKRYGHSD